MNQPVMNTLQIMILKITSHTLMLMKEEIVMKMWYEKIRKKLRNNKKKSLPHYESEQWESQWRKIKLTINFVTCWYEMFEEKKWASAFDC